MTASRSHYGVFGPLLQVSFYTWRKFRVKDQVLKSNSSLDCRFIPEPLAKSRLGLGLLIETGTNITIVVGKTSEVCCQASIDTSLHRSFTGFPQS